MLPSPLRATWTLAVLAALPVAAAPAPAFDVRAMLKLERLSDPQASPDGNWVAWSQTHVGDDAAFTRNTDLWIAPLGGGAPRRLTFHPKTDTSPRFAPDGRSLAFLSARDGAMQVYRLDLAGGEPQRLTSFAGGVSEFAWAGADALVVRADVWPDCGADDACNAKRDAAAGGPKAYDALLFRHWDEWEDGKRSHLFHVPLAGGAVRDLTPGDRDVPTWSLGGGDWSVSKDGREVCFSRNDDAVPALSTNADVFVVPASGGEPQKVASHPGYDGACRFSPDGKKLAFRTQMRAGYEADRWRLMVQDRASGKITELLPQVDRHVEDLAWSADGQALHYVISDDGRDPVFTVPAAGGTPKKLADGTFSSLAAVTGGKWLLAMRASLTAPGEVWRIATDGSGAQAVTKVNDAYLATFGLKPGESVRYQGAAGKDVQAWIVKPANFDPAQKYPLLVLIHGGPQGAWADSWSYRWNPQVLASAGFVVFAPNPRGSVGWGQEFEDDINRDWGGKVYEDLMKGTDFAEALPYVAKGRTVAAGASYGGYMVNWIAGHTDRFKALVSHDGLYDMRSMTLSTEELWFPVWEMGGLPWEIPAEYEKWSPSTYAKNFKTPTLVIHGELDYRVPIEQGMQMFTALQLRGVPSRFLVFHDENHWVLKPANSVRWHDEVIGWLQRWTKE